ncbi:MAG: amidohydrolase [Pseudomonadota bacterium]
MRTLTLGLIQTRTVWHDAVANRALFDRWIDSLTEPVDLLVLPEMFSTGFTMASRTQAETMAGPTVAWMVAQAERLGCALCGSLVIEADGQYFNRLLLVHNDGRIDAYDKRHRFRMAGEHEHYAAGDARRVFQLAGVRILPQVCYDLRFPVFSRNQEDYDLVLYVANWPAPRALAWRTLLRARAIENLVYAVGVNRLGTDGNGIRYLGDSAVVGPTGEALVDCGARESLTRVTLDLTELDGLRDTFPAWQDRDDFTLGIAP